VRVFAAQLISGRPSGKKALRPSEIHRAPGWCVGRSGEEGWGGAARPATRPGCAGAHRTVCAAAPAMLGIPMDAPSRWTLGKIGSAPTKVIVPPVSSGDSTRSSMTERNDALTSQPVDRIGVTKLSLLMLIPIDLLLFRSETLREWKASQIEEYYKAIAAGEAVGWQLIDDEAAEVIEKSERSAITVIADTIYNGGMGSQLGGAGGGGGVIGTGLSLAAEAATLRRSSWKDRKGKHQAPVGLAPAP
jgi:hypothetical protein